MAVLLLVLLAQQTVTISKSDADKASYFAAVKACREAEELLGTDPRGAIDKLDTILDNARIRKLECRMRIEQRAGDYTSYYDFYPLKFRGLARMAVSKESPANAEKLLQGAVEDLQRSVDEGHGASAEPLAEARTSLERIRAGSSVEATAAFRGRWEDLVGSGRFRSARALLDTEGRALPEKDREYFARETEGRCRDFINLRTSSFRRSLDQIKSPADLAGMTGDEFGASFPLPAPGELVGSTPALDWARTWAATLREIQQTRSVRMEALLAGAVSSLPLEERSLNPWFQSAERLAWRAAHESIQEAVNRSQEEPAAGREALRRQAEGALALWRPFEQGLAKDVRERHPFVADHGASLARLLEDFPTDLAELDSVDLEACLASDRPEILLRQAEDRLRGLVTRPRVTRESRRRLFTLLITASAMRELLGGRPEESIVEPLREWGEKLRGFGGPEDPGRFGPRVAKVLDLLAG